MVWSSSCKLYQKLVTQFFSLFLKLNPHTEKVMTRYLQKTKEKKSSNFAHGMLHFVTSKPSHFWISRKENELEVKKRKSTKTNSCCFFLQSLYWLLPKRYLCNDLSFWKKNLVTFLLVTFMVSTDKVVTSVLVSFMVWVQNVVKPKKVLI